MINSKNQIILIFKIDLNRFIKTTMKSSFIFRLCLTKKKFDLLMIARNNIANHYINSDTFWILYFYLPGVWFYTRNVDVVGGKFEQIFERWRLQKLYGGASYFKHKQFLRKQKKRREKESERCGNSIFVVLQ